MQRFFRLVGRAARGRRSVEVDAAVVAYCGKRIELAELASVGIVTTADGPFVPDVFWMLATDGDDRLVIPQEAPEFDGLLARLQTLERFDNAAVPRAMGLAQAAEFLCWHSDAAP